MQIQEKEKRIISKVFIFFVVFVVIPNLVSNYVTRYSYDGRNVQKKLQREERDLNVQLESIEDARVKFRKNDVSYRQWREKGAVSKDTRQDPVEWIKMMGQIKKDRRLNVVRFKFGNGFTIPAESSAYTKGSTAEINLLEMELSMPMLHDLDMFMFIEELKARVDDQFFPVQCRITRSQAQFALQIRNNFQGSCNFVWVAIYDPESREDKIDENNKEQAAGSGQQ
ncbi:MAG: hypothetical protein R1F54_07870 [Candidatus Zeuxoniibacter abyssi]|nr:MAG: hypothetical protein R1F54_07870 [Candidatus Persebacteraceae bacterium AB1(2)]